MDAATWEVGSSIEREDGGFGVTHGQHGVGQSGTMDVQGAVLDM